MTSEDALKKYFGHDAFRDKQKEAITSLLDNKNTLCLMPTGMGKSLIYQVTALMKGDMALVISPLLALMEQQSEVLDSNIKNFGKTSLAFNSNSGNVVKQYKYLRDDFRPPENPNFIFVSPEKMMLDGYAEYVFRQNKSKIGLIVIDEAHCVSQWGHSFRPSYKMIPKFLSDIFGINVPPILCLTATINQIDRQEIVKDFKIENTIVSNSLLRNNIQLNIEQEVKKNDDKRIKLEELLERFKGEKIIVYTHIKSRDYGTRAMSKYYKEKGYSCAPFDADLSKKEKDTTLANFTSGKTKIVFATNAFGMGIDIPDIRCVVHYLLPESIEQYYQEVGRAGRDGLPSFAFLLHAEPNLRIRKDLIRKSAITKDKIENLWSTLHGRKKEIPHVGQLGTNDVSDDNTEMIIFLKLVELGFLSIITKGLQDVKCLVENGIPTQLSYYQSKTKNGFMKLISKKTGQGLASIHQIIFELFHNGKINFIKSPTKLMYYNILKNPDEVDFTSLVNEFELVTQSKMDNLEKLYNVLNKKVDINTALREHLGIVTQ